MDREGVENLRDAPSSGTAGEPGRVHHGGCPDPEVLDLSANVAPRSPPGTEAVYREALERARRYPDDEYRAFREAATERVDCEPAGVVPTAGGLAALRLALSTHVDPGDTVRVPAPSFGEYAREVRLQGARPTFAAPETILETDPTSVAVVVVCAPNNPTGTDYDPAALREYAGCCRDAGTLLLVDEAFRGFTDRPSLSGTPGTVVARSLTKLYGLPGLRAGYAVAGNDADEVGTGDTSASPRDRLATARRAWSLGTPAAAVGTHCLRADAFVADIREQVRTERAFLTERLETDYDVAPSNAPFVLVDVGDSATVDSVIDRCRAADVAVRDARTFRGLDSHVRVAVRDRAASEALLDALDAA